ncbi:hypothetical protein AVEN_227965-1 [Araneus ventricosus]|uniref:Uncharacterized protein n=1 Tax=Araneus ventricosus TaxID=182803 RepID=A0A4Y2X430_ARAVE|nr:hypothetical protein AVEN_227965-1 [Araneus ventricosus]
MRDSTDDILRRHTFGLGQSDSCKDGGLSLDRGCSCHSSVVLWEDVEDRLKTFWPGQICTPHLPRTPTNNTWMVWFKMRSNPAFCSGTKDQEEYGYVFVFNQRKKQ